jgi:prophage tail gpP-like protein
VPDNIVYVIVQGEKLTGWKSVSITKSLETLSGNFSLTMIEKENIERLINTQDLLQVYIDDTKLMTSYIDTMDPTVTPKDIVMTVAGREITADLIDCSAINTPGTWNNIKVIRLIEQLLAPTPTQSFLMAVQSEVVFTKKIKKFSINTGDTVFDGLQKICTTQGVLPITNPDGDIVLVDTGKASGPTVDSLVLGENVISARGNINFKERFSHYSVKGESSGSGGGWGGSSSKIIGAYGEAIDENITRFRPLQIKSEDNTDNAFALRRASWEAQVRAGKSQKLTVTVPEWRQSDGTLWDTNKTAIVKIEPLRIDTSLLIVSLTYELNESGRFTSINLAPPDIYQPEPKPKVKVKKKTGWG